MNKKYKLGVLFLSVFLYLPFAYAQESKLNGQDEVPLVMYEFLTQIVELQPYLYSQQEFASEKNKQFVGERLERFSNVSQQLKKHNRLKTPGFEVPAEIIIKQLHDVNDAFKNGHREYAWRSLRSTLHNCSQCHTQVLQTKQAPQWNFDSKSLPTDPFELADFWFMIRAYDKAYVEFSKVVKGYGKDHQDQFKLKRALKNMMTISLRIDQSPERALEFLGKLENQKKFPKYLNNDVQAWKNELSILKMLPPMNIKTVSVQELEKLIEDLFRSVYPIPREGRSKEVAIEYGSGLLFTFVNSRPKEVTQRMYYWLGISNIELGRFEFTTFGDPYLKECIEKFPPSPISEECYAALEENWFFGYSGSAGTFLPKSYKEELNRLEHVLENKRK